MATNSIRTEREPLPPPLPSTQAANRLTAGWVNSLRRNADAQAQAQAAREGNGNGGQRESRGGGANGGAAGTEQRSGGGAGWSQSRPTSTSTNNSIRPPSLFSIDSSNRGGGPISPTTTVASNTSPSSMFPPPPSPHRHSSAVPSGPKSYHPPRSNLSLPPNAPSRHRDQLQRVYGDSTYDAEFDRGPVASTSRLISTGARQPNSASSSNLLFDTKLGRAQQYSHSSNNQPAQDFRAGADDAASASSSSRRPRSKRDQVDPADLGLRKNGAPIKESKDSLESEENDNPSSSRPTSRSSKESKNRRKREEREGRNGLENGSASAGAVARLFDPRRDDPLKFSSSGPVGAMGGSGGRSGKSASVDTRSFVSSNVSGASGSNVSASEAPPQNDDGGARASEGPEPTQQVQDLKKYLKEITGLEKKLVDDNKALSATLAREEEASTGNIVIQGGATRRFDDQYWVRLASDHKRLADAHFAFLGIALDPVNLTLNDLPRKYNISTRLWQIGFLQLLERMRHAAVAPPSAATSFDSPPTNVVDHLVEFIQYAYTFYTQLLEGNTSNISNYRSTWIEQLGDLARYRMAVAGLALRITASQVTTQQQSQGRLELERASERKAPKAMEMGSIGDAALGDWDVEEHETWREIAKDWYSQGLTEAPGTGRLHHHLAMLSKGDELRSLYHYVKSLSTTHPYPSARESILPLFEDELQARRTQPDVTKAELFVHLHGMLFTKISLDNFEECYERFLERLEEESLLLQRAGSSGWSLLGAGPQAPFGDAEWFMIAVINISALLQYGADDGVLKRSMGKESGARDNSSSVNHNKLRSGPSSIKSKAPQAIMLNPSSLKKAETVNEEEEELSSLSGDGAAGEFVMQLGTASDDEEPLAFQLAQRLTFGMLDVALRHPYRVVDNSKVLNPYITIVLTFVSHLIPQHPSILRHLERSIPWARLVNVLNSIPQPIEVRLDVQSKLQHGPLPEDWCIRGMDWAARSLFKKGFWAPKTGNGSRRDDMAPPPPPMGPASPMAFHSEMEALKIDLQSLDELPTEGDAESAPSVLAGGRWRRLAVVAAWLVRAVPGLDFDPSARPLARFVVSPGLDAKLRRWKQEDRDATEAERQSRLSAWAGEVDEEDVEESESDEEDEDETDSSDVRELKTRRRQLKAVLKQARQATRSAKPSIRRISASRQKKASLGRSSLTVFAGHTVLVFDTNILLSSMKLFRDLLETKKWTLVVPLAVVTELDGLKKNPAPLGTAANDAVVYLESAIRQYPHHLKLQTSHGNYLKDLSIRSEQIDFAGNGGEDGGFSADFARSMDDVILRAVAWQKDHFTSRLALVNPSADRRQIPTNVSSVVLVTFDRNLRLKARARGLDAADEKDMSLLLGSKEENG